MFQEQQMILNMYLLLVFFYLRTGSGYIYIILTFDKLSSRVVKVNIGGRHATYVVSGTHHGKGLSVPGGPVSSPQLLQILAGIEANLLREKAFD